MAIGHCGVVEHALPGPMSSSVLAQPACQPGPTRPITPSGEIGATSEVLAGRETFNAGYHTRIRKPVENPYESSSCNHMAMKHWIASALQRLKECLSPVPYEVNELDWKARLSEHCRPGLPTT